MGTRSRRVRKQRGGAIIRTMIETKLKDVFALNEGDLDKVITMYDEEGGGYWTLLAYAINENNPKAALELLAKGADPTKKGDFPATEYLKRYVEGVNLST